MKKVSVIIPTYKRSDMLHRAINSVLGQTYLNTEVIVVDDNNPDTEWRRYTSETMRCYSDNPRVLYICHDKNMNGSVARNTGIHAATGEIITYLDDDDIYMPDKIEKQVKYLESHPQFRAVYCGWNRDGHNFLPKGEGDLSYGILSGNNLIITNSIMIWRKDAIVCGGWDENLTRHQEAAFLLNYFRYGGKIGRINDVLVNFDTADRTNVSKPEINEKQLLYLLEKNKDLIYKCEQKSKGAKNRIYSSRYLGIILPYLKASQYRSALNCFIRYFIKMPFPMLSMCIRYIFNRLSSRHIQQSR